jgi:hypothetical protein
MMPVVVFVEKVVIEQVSTSIRLFRHGRYEEFGQHSAMRLAWVATVHRRHGISVWGLRPLLPWMLNLRRFEDSVGSAAYGGRTIRMP